MVLGGPKHCISGRSVFQIFSFSQNQDIKKFEIVRSRDVSLGFCFGVNKQTFMMCTRPSKTISDIYQRCKIDFLISRILFKKLGFLSKIFENPDIAIPIWSSSRGRPILATLGYVLLTYVC